MTPDVRRRLGALTALAVGLFLGLTLLPLRVTGPVGAWLGQELWHVLGLGALGVPILGVGLALAGFERLGRLDMKRAGGLIVGLSVLVPYLIGVFGRVGAAELSIPVANRPLTARLTGLVPGFWAQLVVGGVGVAGAVLLGFLGLSALTLATFAWHPLHKLERKPELEPETPKRARKTPVPAKAAAAVELPESPKEKEREREREKDEFPRGREREPKPAKPAKPARKPEPRRAPGAEQLGPVWDVELLEPPRTKGIDAGEAELDVLQERLEATLAEFKVEGDVAGRTTGPVVTQYGVRLRPGVKMNRLVTLADDLALKMSARSIRVARIPGKDMVGVEVPNPKSRMVVLRELLEDEQWNAEERLLPVALGLDLEGRPVVADLAKMPHLLIAGATGTGKSVGINAIITSLIYHYQHKEDLRFLMIDPKMVELSMYKDLPHLRH
ncbi:MAG TPA: DNA translocase FtsK, partial [Gemmatimonadales bacterium]|nr:DNA translocase FtsK [Gemmatimonadales bacterium]